MDNSKHENVADPSNIENAGTGRSYECNFCKRGFTNAQALGGHMNIHRKEKAKAGKQSNIFLKTSFSNPIFSDQHIDIESSKCSEANFNHQFYNFPLPNPSHSPYACYQSDPSSTVVASSKNLDSNLSLDMGSWPSTKNDEDVNERDERMEHEVDLELRLGHYTKK